MYVSTVSSCQISAKMPSSCLARCHLLTLRPPLEGKKIHVNMQWAPPLCSGPPNFCTFWLFLSRSNARDCLTCVYLPFLANIHRSVGRPRTTCETSDSMGLWHRFLKFANPPQFSLPSRVLDKTLEQHLKLQNASLFIQISSSKPLSAIDVW